MEAAEVFLGTVEGAVLGPPRGDVKHGEPDFTPTGLQLHSRFFSNYTFRFPNPLLKICISHGQCSDHVHTAF